MAKGGARQGAGRKRGGKNAKSAEIAQKAAAAGLTPLEYMLDILRGKPPEGADVVQILAYESMRFEAAKAAAPYVHPRLAAVEHSGKDGGPLEIIHRMANA